MTEPTEISTQVQGLHRRADQVQRAIAEVSHEIRNQLAGILGLAQVALQTQSPDEQAEYLSLIHHTGEELLTLVNDVLDLSKVEAGQLRMDAIPFSLPGCVRGAVATLSPAASVKGLRLDTIFDSSIPSHVIGDPGRLRQVLVNLVSNAVKFTESGGVEVRVAPARDDEDSTLEFSVLDSGLGVPEDMREAIFDPFTQAHTQTRGSGEGTGLGLAICRQLVELMGGRIWVEPRPEGGSVFRFTAALPPHDAPVAVGTETAGRLSGRTVLVVSHDPAASSQALEALAAEGVSRVETVAPDRVAAEIDSRIGGEHPVALVVFDRLGDFRSELTRLRALPSSKGVHAAVLSAGGQRGDGEFCRSQRAGCYLTYPLAPEELRAGLRTLLEGPAPDRLQFPITKHWLRETGSVDVS